MPHMTVVETVYHHLGSPGPTAVDNRFRRDLSTDEAPYCRPRAKADGEWRELDTGWLEGKCSHLVLVNEEPKAGGPQGGSTEDVSIKDGTETEEPKNDKTLELGIWIPPPVHLQDLWDGEIVPFARVPPRESVRITPLDVTRLRVRAPGGGLVRYSAHFLPE